MPRKSEPINPELPYHISARCHNREWFKMPLNDVWEVMSDYLYLIRGAFGAEITSFVLMSNHFHLIARFPENNMGSALNYFMRETSKNINALSGHTNQVYGGRNHKTAITSTHHFLHAYKYVYRNPVEARMVARACDYPYSTLFSKIGRARSTIPFVEDDTLFSDLSGTLKWLDEAPNERNRLLVSEALRRPVFSLSKRDFEGQSHNLEIEKY